MDLFKPVTSGTFAGGVSADFIPALAERVQSGMFPMASESRNAYEVVSQDADSLRFRTTNLWSATNVGLNDVTVTLHNNKVDYIIKYWTWTKYGVGLCFSILVTFVLLMTVGRLIFPPAWFADFDNSPWFGIAMIVFWGLLWPWILTVMHKGPARRCLERIIEEVNESCTQRVSP